MLEFLYHDLIWCNGISAFVSDMPFKGKQFGVFDNTNIDLIYFIYINYRLSTNYDETVKISSNICYKNNEIDILLVHI